jgi:hypothetical protein
MKFGRDTMSPRISKSKFLWGLQCPKLLSTTYNAKHLIPEPDAAQQAVFDQGHEVGALAKRLHPDGSEIIASATDLACAHGGHRNLDSVIFFD